MGLALGLGAASEPAPANVRPMGARPAAA